MNDSLSYIDRYFQDELPPGEKKTFESRCLSDPAFAQMVAFYISIHDHLKEHWIERKKQEFAQLEAAGFPVDEAFPLNGELDINELYQEKEREVPASHQERGSEESGSLKEETSSLRSLPGQTWKDDQDKVRPMKTWKRLAVAAALLGVIALGITMYVQNSNNGTAVATNNKKAETTKNNTTADTSSAYKNVVVDTTTKQAGQEKETPKKRLGQTEGQQLFAQHFTPDAPPEEKQELLEEAFEQYKKGSYQEASRDYEDALAIMDNLATRRPEGEQELTERKQILFYAHYYNGLSYMAAGKTAKAIKELKAIKESPDKYWQSKQQWYLALAYLKTGEIAKASALLKQVAASKHAGDYSQMAMQLTRKLKDASTN